MTIALGINERVAFKEYATGVITPNVEPDPATDPGASGGQVLRCTSCNFKMSKRTFQSQEIRTDAQIAHFRHGGRQVPGTIGGELSPGTYFDPINAVHRATAGSALSLGETEFTSVTSDDATSKFTLTAGDPVSEGLRVGDIIRFSDLATAANNNKNFLITGFGGTSNREITVDPAPATDAVADTAFTLARPGKTSAPPSDNRVKRKFAIERYNGDIDVTRLFTEVRFGGYAIRLPAEGATGIELVGLGRNRVRYTGGASPFFTSPAAATTTDFCAAVDGIVRVGGSQVATITGIELTATLSPEGQPVAGQNITPEVFQGRYVLTGRLTGMLEDSTFMDAFDNETELELLVKVASSGDANAEAISFHLPRTKLIDEDAPLQGEGGLLFSAPFQALKYLGSAAGVTASTIYIHDTAAA